MTIIMITHIELAPEMIVDPITHIITGKAYLHKEVKQVLGQHSARVLYACIRPKIHNH